MNTWEKTIVQTTKHEISVTFFMFTAVPESIMSRKRARFKIMLGGGGGRHRRILKII
jgi:hypothetical protein